MDILKALEIALQNLHNRVDVDEKSLRSTSIAYLEPRNLEVPPELEAGFKKLTKSFQDRDVSPDKIRQKIIRKHPEWSFTFEIQGEMSVFLIVTVDIETGEAKVSSKF